MTLVACANKMVFPVDDTTLKPLRCAQYDPWIFSDPPSETIVISYAEWLKRSAATAIGNRRA